MNADYHLWSIDDFFREAAGWKRPLFLIAHQDDDLAYGGLIQRLGPKTRFVWVTNGDGLYFEANLPPKDYSEIRMREAVRAVGAVGIPEAHTRCLECSEVQIYRNMSYLHYDPTLVENQHPFWDRIRQQVRNALFDIRPDAVFTCAWQGGHPEHDLTHYFTRLAVDDFELETGKPLPFFHLPEYEYTIFVAFRFHPLYKGRRLKFSLTPEELEGKKRIIEQYPSQARLFEDFDGVLGKLSLITRWTGGPTTPEEYLSQEHFGPVAQDLDYTQSTHILDAANYIFDDFHGVPISFSRSVRPVVQSFERIAPGAQRLYEKHCGDVNVSYSEKLSLAYTVG